MTASELVVELATWEEAEEEVWTTVLFGVDVVWDEAAVDKIVEEFETTEEDTRPLERDADDVADT